MRNAVGVDAVLEDGHAVAPLAQERQLRLQRAGRPVGNGPDVPLRPVAACHGGVLAHRGVERHGLVPDGRHGGDERRELGRAQVVRRRVAEHLQRTLEEDVEGGLMGARALAHGVVPADREVGLRGVARRTGRVVHRSGDHAREGERAVVHGRDVGRALVVLHAVDPFKGQHVGVFALQSGRLEGAVEVDEQPAVERRAGDLLVEAHHLLVGALHEVDLDALDAPVAVGVEDPLEVPFHGVPQRPEHHADPLLAAVADQLRKVHLRTRFADVERAHGPPLVEQDVFDAVAGGEVDVVFVGLRVDSGAEIDAVEVERVPPLPRNLARPHPRGVALDRWRGQHPGEVVLEQRAVVGVDRHQPPREGARPLRAGDIGGRPHELFVAVRALLEAALQHDGREGGARNAPFGSQEHAGVVLQVGFGDNHARAAGRGEPDGQEGVAHAVGPGDGLADERRLAVRDKIGGRLAGPKRFGTLREAELRTLPFNLHVPLAGGLETIGGAVVVDAQPHGPAAAERNQQLVAAVAHLAELRGHLGRHPLIHGAARDTPHGAPFAEGLLAREFQSDAARVDEPLAVALHTPRQDGVGRHGDDDPPVGRGDRVLPGAECRCGRQQKGGQKKHLFHRGCFSVVCAADAAASSAR